MRSKLLITLLLLVSCQPKLEDYPPTLTTTPQQAKVDHLLSPFPNFTEQEKTTEWGYEMWLALRFARELDLYRAITGFKRALFLLPDTELKRRHQINYHILSCYYLGEKYSDVIASFEKSSLVEVGRSFPAFHDLLLMLHDSYGKIGNEHKAAQFLQAIENDSPETKAKLDLATAFHSTDLDKIAIVTGKKKDYLDFLNTYRQGKLSAKKARNLNALCPGAGYWYIGQKKSAVTSFLLNAMFIAGTTQLFCEGHVGLGLFTLSLETGWYFGGIHGAGLAAQEYNQLLYQDLANPLMAEEKLFPLMMLRYGF